MQRLILLCCLGFFISPVWALISLEDSASFGRILWQAERADSDSTMPPIAALWRPLELPDSWTVRGSAPPTGISWYRFTVPDNLPEAHRQAVFLDRILSNAEVYFNTDYLGNGGSSVVPIASNWNTPYLFTIPASSWRASFNVIYIRLIGDGGYGMLPPPIVGNYQQLRQYLYTPKRLVRVELARASFVVMLLLGVFSLFMWYRTRQAILLYAGFASLIWMLPLAYSFGLNIGLSHPQFLRLTHWCIDACGMLIFLFARAKYGLSRQRWHYWIVAYLSILALVIALLPETNIVTVANLLHLFPQAIVLYLIVYTARAYWRSRSPSDLSFCIGLLVLFGFFVHDVSLSLSKDLNRWFYDPHLGHLSLPVMFLLLCFSVSNMYKNYVIQAQQLNHRLKLRLQAAKQELAVQMRNSQRLLAEQRINQEREQVYRDLHDDLGARLLSLVYASPEPKKNDLARSALQDLRDVVSRRSHSRLALAALLADVVEDQISRCDKLAIDLKVAINDIDAGIVYPAQNALLLRRLFREMVGIFVHQLSADKIVISIVGGLTGVEIVIEAAGGLDKLDLTNIETRARRLTGSLQARQTDLGVQLICWLPHN